MQVSIKSTKSKIFNASLRLFAENGYENVSVRQIADTVGIKAASIYTHYESKEKILEECYEFYLYNRYKKRLIKEQYESIVKNGAKEEVMNIFNYSWEDSIHENMFYALLIIYSRIYSDGRAKKIYEKEINDAIEYMSEIFNFGIKIGRFNKFNISTVSLIVLSTRLFAAHSATITPEENAEWHIAQVKFFDELIKLIPFKY